MLAGWGNALEEVQANSHVGVGWMEIDHVIRAPAGNVIEEIDGEIAMRIDDPDAMSSFNVLEDEVPEERRLARAGLSEHVQMLTAVGRGKAERLVASPSLPHTQAERVLSRFILHVPTRRLLRRESICLGFDKANELAHTSANHEL
jgi:hypothetical protein